MTKKTPPETYEALIREIHDRYAGMSNSYQRIALYLTQNPNDVAVRSVNAIGEGCGVHASSFVRFAQSLGYRASRSSRPSSSAAFPLLPPASKLASRSCERSSARARTRVMWACYAIWWCATSLRSRIC